MESSEKVAEPTASPSAAKSKTTPQTDPAPEEKPQDQPAGRNTPAEKSVPASSQDSPSVTKAQTDGAAGGEKTNEKVNEEVNEKGANDIATEEAGKGPEEHDAEAKYLSGIVLVFLVAALCLVTFMVGLDQMIIATAIPKITTQFHSLEDVGWYGSAYLLTTTSLQPSYGKLYSYFNVKWTFVFAMFVFELGSILCAVARNSPALIVGRAIAGTGAAGLYSGGMTIIGYSVPLRRRAMYLASLASMFGIASIVGPILGGAFTDKLSWRWCFWINLPFGGLAIATVAFFFKNPDRRYTHKTLREKIYEMDLPGAFFLISAIVCLLLALQWVRETADGILGGEERCDANDAAGRHNLPLA